MFLKQSHSLHTCNGHRNVYPYNSIISTKHGH